MAVSLEMFLGGFVPKIGQTPGQNSGQKSGQKPVQNLVSSSYTLLDQIDRRLLAMFESYDRKPKKEFGLLLSLEL